MNIFLEYTGKCWRCTQHKVPFHWNPLHNCEVLEVGNFPWSTFEDVKHHLIQRNYRWELWNSSNNFPLPFALIHSLQCTSSFFLSNANCDLNRFCRHNENALRLKMKFCGVEFFRNKKIINWVFSSRLSSQASADIETYRTLYIS